eukprot:tig00001284_g8004.t1
MRGVACSMNGDIVAFGGDDALVNLYSKVLAPGAPAAAAGFAQRWVAVYHGNGTCTSGVWSMDMTEDPVNVHQGQSEADHLIASAGADGAVGVWSARSNAAQPRPIQELMQGIFYVSSVAISKDGAVIVAGGANGTTDIWKIIGQRQFEPYAFIGGLNPHVPPNAPAASRGEVLHVRLPDEWTGPVSAVALSPDAKLVAVAVFNEQRKRTFVLLFRTELRAGDLADALVAQVASVYTESLDRKSEGARSIYGVHSISFAQDVVAFGSGEGKAWVYRIPPGAAEAAGQVALALVGEYLFECVGEPDQNFNTKPLPVRVIKLFPDGSGFVVGSDVEVNSKKPTDHGFDAVVHVCTLPASGAGSSSSSAPPCTLVEKFFLEEAKGVHGLALTADGRTIFASCEDWSVRALSLVPRPPSPAASSSSASAAACTGARSHLQPKLKAEKRPAELELESAKRPALGPLKAEKKALDLAAGSAETAKRSAGPAADKKPSPRNPPPAPAPSLPPASVSPSGFGPWPAAAECGAGPSEQRLASAEAPAMDDREPEAGTTAGGSRGSEPPRTAAEALEHFRRLFGEETHARLRPQLQQAEQRASAAEQRQRDAETRAAAAEARAAAAEEAARAAVEVTEARAMAAERRAAGAEGEAERLRGRVRELEEDLERAAAMRAVGEAAMKAMRDFEKSHK